MSLPPPKSTHSQILKSSALIGGSSAVAILVGMIRVKLTAVYLGPLGVGLFGAYSTILGPLATLAGMGIATSGVRQIAEAAGAGNQEQIARSLLTVRRASIVSGLLGMLLLIALAYPLSLATFGDAKQVVPLCILSVTLFIGAVSGGLGAILQGLRRIRDMAMQGILGAVLGLPVAVPLMMLWRVDSIVPMMLVTAVMGLAITWWFTRQVTVVATKMSWRESWMEAKPMLKLGLVFVSTGLMGAGVAYLTRVIIIRKLGLEANGLYSSAWTLSSYYVGFILGAMGTDFYPRLTEVNHDHAEVNRLVNEQTEVGLLMALPGIIATLTLAPLVIMTFYTAEFMPAVELLQWQSLGLMGRVIAWPIGFIMLAKGAKRCFFYSELSANVVLLGFTWLGVVDFGLAGTGMAVLALYLCMTIWVLLIVRRLTGFRWSSACNRLIAFAAIASVGSFVIARFLPLAWSAAIGALLAAATAGYSLRSLTRLVGRNPLAAAWEKFRRILQPSRSGQC
jgi:PST family polysaccharide transporter